MVIVKTVEEFHRQNENELRDFMMFKTGIRDKDMIDDTIQEFYVRLIKSKALEEFDENIARPGTEQTLFETWICNMFCWLLPVMKKRNFRDRFEVVSTVSIERNGCEADIDVWDVVSDSSGLGPDFSVADGYYSDHVGLESLEMFEHCMNSFIRYVERTESSEVAYQLVTYIRNRDTGLNGVDISMILKVSNATVNSIKNTTLRKLKEWKAQCLSL